MKAIAILLVCTWMTQVAHGHCGKANHISSKEQKALIAEADAGDADAAYQIWNYHSFSTRDEKQAAKWLDRAAELGHTEAQRWLAHMIVEHRSSHDTFGKTPEAAVLKLLTDASKSDGFAAHNLGERYYEGYFGEADKHVKAREAFQLAASHHSAWCWKHLAKMLHAGEGGKANQIEAYYYICLDTQCTHPESVGGEELWVLRCKIEESLSLAQAKRVWKRVDSYISKERKRSGGRIYPPPLLGTGIPEKKWKEYLKVTDDFEARHRKQLETTIGEQVGARQPATAVDSKSEGKEKPKPEAEGRSQ